MAKTLNLKIKELQEKKSKLDKSILEIQKKKYEQRIKKILSGPVAEGEEKETLNKAMDYQAKLNEIESKIKEIPEDAEKIIKKIDEKLDKYQKDSERIKNIPLYKDTEEGIAEILCSDPLYQYAKETDNKELIKKLEGRKLTIDEYTTFTEKMYKEVFAPILKKKNKDTEIQKAPKIELPEGMTEKIKEMLKNNKEFTIEEIEDFLKKELKKNGGEIMLSHIKNKFKERQNKAFDIIKAIILDYSEFKIIDNSEKENKTTTNKKSKNEKLIATLNPDSQKGKEITKNQLLKEISKTGEEMDLEKRLDIYINILEKLGHKFSDKESFKTQTKESIETQTSIKIEEGIKNTLKKIIKGTLTLSKKYAFGYRAYELGKKYDSRRIVLYPNKEIIKICSHDEYENIINTRPPSDKK